MFMKSKSQLRLLSMKLLCLGIFPGNSQFSHISLGRKFIVPKERILLSYIEHRIFIGREKIFHNRRDVQYLSKAASD